MAPLPPRGGIGASRHRPELPAFCRTRRPTTLVSVISLRHLQRLLLLVLLFQLSTLLLLVAVVGPQHHLSPYPSSPSVMERGQQ